MVDLHGKDKGNISLPPRLQSPEVEDRNAEETRGGGRRKEVPVIINMQKAVYEIKIADIETRISRLEDRNNELADEVEATNQLLSTTDAGTAERIGALTRQVTEESKKIQTAKRKIEETENSRKDDRDGHENYTQSFNERYKRKRIELFSKIKVLSAKINQLEDFKKTQDALREKLKLRNELMSEKEKEVEETLEKIERKFKFDRETLKKEMYKRLLDLAAVYEMQVAKNMDLSVQKLMRENIMLKKEFAEISREHGKRIEDYGEYKASMERHGRNIREKNTENRRNLVSIKIQSHLSRFLKNSHEEWTKRFRGVKIPGRTEEQRCLRRIEESRRKESEAASRLAEMEVLVHEETLRIAVSKQFCRDVECKIKKCVETLFDLKDTIVWTLENVDTCIDTKMSYTELVSYLDEILMDQDIRRRIVLHLGTRAPKKSRRKGTLSREPSTQTTEYEVRQERSEAYGESRDQTEDFDEDQSIQEEMSLREEEESSLDDQGAEEEERKGPEAETEEFLEENGSLESKKSQESFESIED